jgi:transcriptional regulator with XRE-family HTH domain
MDNTLAILSGRIKEYRILKHLTQQELADNSGMTRYHVEAIENGRQDIGTKNLLSLAKGFHISLPQMIQVVFDITQPANSVYVYAKFPHGDGEQPENLISLPDVSSGSEAYVVTPEGWEPFLHQGDYVITDPGADLVSGDYVLCLVGEVIRVGMIQKIESEL